MSLKAFWLNFFVGYPCLIKTDARTKQVGCNLPKTDPTCFDFHTVDDLSTLTNPEYCCSFKLLTH